MSMIDFATFSISLFCSIAFDWGTFSQIQNAIPSISDNKIQYYPSRIRIIVSLVYIIPVLLILNHDRPDWLIYIIFFGVIAHVSLIYLAVVRNEP
jgi:hypothetical protein